jgi:hypothetical protein
MLISTCFSGNKKKSEGDTPRIEKGQVTGDGLHGLEGMTLKHLRMIAVSGEFFAPGNIVIWSLPLPIVDQRVTSGNLVEKNVPCDLGNDVANLPACRFL